MINHRELIKHKTLNLLQTSALLLLLAVLLKYITIFVGGGPFVWMALLMLLGMYAVNQMIAPSLMLFMIRARRLKEYEAPDIFRNLRLLTQRAGLEHPPVLYSVPGNIMNAFAVGKSDNSAIALSDGLLRHLNAMEIAGVLAHELSHIKNNDMWVMGLADVSSRSTKMLSWMGQLYLLFNLPLILIGQASLNVLPLLLLIAAPLFTDLIQLALSRVREFNADVGAATLLGRPEPLASALQKMERYQGTLFQRLFPFTRREPESVLLRTHPPTRERIQRLLQFRASGGTRPTRQQQASFHCV